MPEISSSHLVVIPSFNTGRLLRPTVLSALAKWGTVWVVVDGSTDGSDKDLESITDHPGFRILRLPVNQGKGAAVLFAAREALARGFTHFLTMDSDGQHCADDIPALMECSRLHPGAMVLGKPVFDDAAPKLRVWGRKISNGWTHVETLWAGIGDSLFGFRVYPVEPLIKVMENTTWARRFDFDVEVVIRLVWEGVVPVNFPTPVRYPKREDGGISQFRYFRDNTLLTWMHARLFLGFLPRFPGLLVRRLLNKPPFGHDKMKAPV